ncbi:MAG: hypothetical protein GY784_03420 [Gammaproteobacteria bacterium]|nr:hypothetical protein [Gammaproteobacteria bacterium]
MSELLIPFGIHRHSGDIVEPEDARKGRDCDCLCPGCKTPLLSRHPKVKRYHFAHDSRHELAKPEAVCPFNSALAVALMVKNIAPSLTGQLIGTPGYRLPLDFDCCWEKTRYIPISRGSMVHIDAIEVSASFKAHRFDLLVTTGNYSILIDLLYKGKSAASMPLSELTASDPGILELDCDSFSIASLKADRSKRFSTAVSDFVLKKGSRTWRYHPRQQAVLQLARDKHRCHPRNKIVSHKAPVSNSLKSDYSSWETTVPAKPEIPQPPVVSKAYYCVRCESDWVHRSDQEFECPKCNTHLFSREQPV